MNVSEVKALIRACSRKYHLSIEGREDGTRSGIILAPDSNHQVVAHHMRWDEVAPAQRMVEMAESGEALPLKVTSDDGLVMELTEDK